jgi:hypothetical protein
LVRRVWYKDHLLEGTAHTTAHLYVFSQFVEQLGDVELTQGYFQQDGATCHTTRESAAMIRNSSEDGTFSKNLWPPRSPDLTSPDLFL